MNAALKVAETDADRTWAPRNPPEACCADPANLETIEKDEHVVVRRCSCGRRHFRAIGIMLNGGVRVG